MKTIGFIIFLVANGLFATVLAFSEETSRSLESNKENVIIDISNRFLDTTGVNVQATSMLDVLLVFIVTAIFFLAALYLIFEIFLFLNFIGSRNKRYLK